MAASRFRRWLGRAVNAQPERVPTQGRAMAVACYFQMLRRSMEPERHADVDLHLRQTRSPAHALGNGFRHSRHFLILGSDVVRVSMSVCIGVRRYAAFRSWEQNTAAQYARFIDFAGQKGVRRTPPDLLISTWGETP
jgi:hypothetical protein